MTRIKSSTFELMKIFSDPRRLHILHMASDEPVSVKQLADELQEQPSRLYYHVKKLEEAELLEVVETKIIGNLVEKYYQAVNFKDVLYRGDVQLQASQPELSLSLTYQLIEPAIKLFEKGLDIVRKEKEKGNELKRLPFQVTFNSASKRMTAKEWHLSMEHSMKILTADNESIDKVWKDDIFEQIHEDELNRKGTYQHIIISYRIEDAEEAGISRNKKMENNE